MDYDPSEEEKTFFQRHKLLAIVGGLLLLSGTIALAKYITDKTPETKKPKKAQTVFVSPLPPPPPPPPPPPEPKEKPPEPEMIEQPPEPEMQPENEPPPDAPPATGIAGDGPPDGFGLSAEGGGGFFGRGSGGGAGTRWGRYAREVQSAITRAIQRHPKMRLITLEAEVRIWADGTGKVTKATIYAPSEDQDILQMLREEVLTGLRLEAPPPSDMPMPIVMRVEARNPQ